MPLFSVRIERVDEVDAEWSEVPDGSPKVVPGIWRDPGSSEKSCGKLTPMPPMIHTTTNPGAQESIGITYGGLTEEEHTARGRRNQVLLEIILILGIIIAIVVKIAL